MSIFITSFTTVKYPLMGVWINVLNTYNGILFSLKKEENSNTCYNMVDP